MDGLHCQSSRRAHSFFALFTLSLLSFFAYFSRRTAPSPHHDHHYRRALQPCERAVESSPLPSLNTPSGTPPAQPLLLHSLSLSGPQPSPPTPPITPSTSSPTTTAISSTTTTTTTSSLVSSTPGPHSTSSTPTTTISTSSSAVSTPASSTTTTHSLIPDVTPSTTLFLGVDDSPTSTVESYVGPSSTEISSNSTSSASRFWDNKGAVAATFTLVGLLALAFAIMIVVMILKRQKAKRDALIDAEFMPNYQEPKSRSSSPTPSISSTPLDPFKSREVVHDTVPTDIPASLGPYFSGGRELPTIHLTPPSAFLDPSRYLLPTQLQGQSAASASGQRNKAEMRASTQSGYQPSFDSFYGAYSPT